MKRIITGLAFVLLTCTGYSQQIAKWKITDVEKMMNWKDSGILVLNFWATFCKPCVAEIPSFIKITKKYKGSNVRLILISLDLPSAFPEKIATFAKERKFTTKLAWLEETNADYFCPVVDKSWSGSIPATLVVNTNTGFRKFNEGEMTEKEFEKMIVEAIGIEGKEHVPDR